MNVNAISLQTPSENLLLFFAFLLRNHGYYIYLFFDELLILSYSTPLFLCI